MVILAWIGATEELKTEKVIDPSVDDIKAFMSKLDGEWRRSFGISHERRLALIVLNATEKRVVVTFLGKDEEGRRYVGRLLDPAYADSDESIELIGDPLRGQHYLHDTAQKDIAIDVLAYFAQHGLLSKDHMWGAFRGSVDEFTG